jgi:hypothetical protein
LQTTADRRESDTRSVEDDNKTSDEGAIIETKSKNKNKLKGSARVEHNRNESLGYYNSTTELNTSNGSKKNIKKNSREERTKEMKFCGGSNTSCKECQIF